jgi:hypothetical protein
MNLGAVMPIPGTTVIPIEGITVMPGTVTVFIVEGLIPPPKPTEGDILIWL